VKPEGQRPLGRPRRRWGIILKWISKNSTVNWIDLAQDKGQVVGSYECQHLGCITCGEFLDQLRYYQLFKKDSSSQG
jgi:hypothetical protein